MKSKKVKTQKVKTYKKKRIEGIKRYVTFLKEKGECYVINPHSDFEFLPALLMAANIDQEESCGVGVCGCYKQYAAITSGKKRLLVTKRLINTFCEDNGCFIGELIEKRYLYRISLQSYLVHKQQVKEERANHKTDWVSETRSELKKKSTRYEHIVYKSLQRSGVKGMIVQYPINVNRHQYFLDIFLKDINVAIEVDGGYHNDELQKLHDEERDRLLRIAGIRTYRILNEDVVCREKLDSFVRTIRSLFQ